MKLAEALIERSDIQTRINVLSNRLDNNALVQEGEEPAENPEVLLSELYELEDSLEELVTKINLTNARTFIDGISLTALISKRERLTSKVNILRSFLDSASRRIQRGTKSEIVIKSTVSVSDLQKKVDALSRELRVCDTAIQSANWTTELL